MKAKAVESPQVPREGGTREAPEPMSEQYEAKALDIDPVEMAGRIARAGGSHVADRRLRRHVYGMTPGDRRRWIRLCDTGGRVTVSTNELSPDGTKGIKRTEVAVGNFEAAHALLERMGFTAKAYQENHRSSWLVGGVRLEIASWPLIPPYLGLEGETAEKVHTVAEQLGLHRELLTNENTTSVYARHGISLGAMTNLCFTADPVHHG